MTQELIERLERQAREVEGDSDNPLRVAHANKLWERIADLRASLTKDSTNVTE